MKQRRLAVFLGPYRNLSTLTAAVLSLHPDIQVLNHAAKRFWTAGSDLDFLGTPDQATLDRFIEAGWELSAGGERGLLGGSILHSHAYDDARMKERYRDRYGDALVKPEASWLIWKESMLVQNRLMASPDLFETLCDAFPDLRFILPIRRPLDCAFSNHAKGLLPSMLLPSDATIEVTLGRVLDAFAWALDKRDRHPDRVFAFTQKDTPSAALRPLADFLDIPAYDQWLADAEAAFVVRDRYKFAPETLVYAQRQMEAKLGRWPDVVEALG